MIRSGQSRFSSAPRYRLTRSAHSSQDRSLSSFTEAAARFSASWPSTSRWPNSVLGTRLPFRNSALPMPVPKVSSVTTPDRFTPAPNRISARPAASASLSTTTWSLANPSRIANSAAASVLIHRLSTLAAVSAVPCFTTQGRVMPTGPSQANFSTISATTSATASGVDGCGVGMRRRSPSSAPASRSTRPPLMPEPPMSTPNPRVVPPIPVVPSYSIQSVVSAESSLV